MFRDTVWGRNMVKIPVKGAGCPYFPALRGIKQTLSAVKSVQFEAVDSPKSVRAGP